MGGSDSTCWTVIRGAAEGKGDAKEEFARRYAPVVRSYLGARWRGSTLAGEVEDAAQEVFVDCFREGGVLDRADPARPGGFRAYLFGVVRTVALRFESARARRRDRPAEEAESFASFPGSGDSPSREFDRNWALALLREATSLQEERARRAGEGPSRRAELLRLRFREGQPVRAIAERWGEEPAKVHKEYARAREEYRAALREVVSFHHPGTPGEVDREIQRLLGLFQ